GALNERTEGWVAALRLAALSLRDTFDRASFMEHLDNYTARSINSYLVGEILTQQTHEVQEFLEQTSILDQFCTELCAEVMGGDSSCPLGERPIEGDATGGSALFSSIRAGAVGASRTLATRAAGGTDPGKPIPLGRASVDIPGPRAS